MPVWSERFGQYEFEKHDERVWFHAVSVGEVLAAKPILESLRHEMPKAEIVLSVTTSSGHQTATDQLKSLVDRIVYFPIDVARFQLGAMQRMRPRVAVLMETELWFNFLWAADAFDVPVLLVNGRISDKSFSRLSRVKLFTRSLVGYLESALMQTDTDTERIKSFGARDARTLGNSKFDQASDTDGLTADQWRDQLGLAADEPVLVFGSIRHEEFELCLRAAKETLPHARVIFAPRHLDRVQELSQAYESVFGEGSFAKAPKRSAGAHVSSSEPLLLDTYGELGSVYRIATLAVIGGGFADLGGQNLIQPLGHGVPVLHGRNMRNFRDVAESASRVGCAITVEQPQQLGEEILRRLQDSEWREAASQRARSYVNANLGASWRYAREIARAARAAEKKSKGKVQR
jgi:3-deoxy-D-manno-octulosonic-acid transferase